LNIEGASIGHTGCKACRETTRKRRRKNEWRGLDMLRKYEKSFGTFELNFEKSETEVKIRYRINDEKFFNCKGFNQEKKAVVFYCATSIKVDGKIIKVDGISLLDFDDVYAEYNRMKKELTEEIEAKKNAEIEAIKSGAQKIKLHYHDGEYLSGYEAYGLDAALLLELGFAEHVDSWGYRIDDAHVKTLGTEFTYQQVAELMAPIIAEKERKANAKADARQAIFQKAKDTGVKQILLNWMDDCDTPGIECSFDNMCEYAMPDGTVKLTRTHCY